AHQHRAVKEAELNPGRFIGDLLAGIGSGTAPDEEKLLLGRQIRYRINQVEEIKGQLVLHAEVIGQHV
ncbi:hypothetical protein, partial [uncultured Corynebacterium sp.]|uniref:hypothetical protein n=1 Tax=uncultured Corynebacterium sp. TaxID=159447 RepID=UPI00259A9D6A